MAETDWTKSGGRLDKPLTIEVTKGMAERPVIQLPVQSLTGYPANSCPNTFANLAMRFVAILRLLQLANLNE